MEIDCHSFVYNSLIEMMKEHIKQSKEEQVILIQKCEEMCTGNVKAQENYFEGK